jgi:DNA polymerase III subunit beta
MKFSCQTDALLQAFQFVAAAAAARTTIAVLSNVKVVAEDDALILTGTDTEITIRFELRGVEVKRAGQAVLPPQRLIAILRESSEELVNIETTENKALVKCGSSKYELVTGDPAAFPELEATDKGEDYHEVTAGLLRTMIRRVAFAADKKEGTRWAVTGILWEAEKDRIRLVATDTKRLALIEGSAVVHGDGTDPKGPSHLIPVKAIQLLERHLSDDAEPIQIILRQNSAIFQTGRWVIHTKLVEGRFPPYRDIIPKKSPIRVQLDAPQFSAKVRQAQITSDEEAKRVDFNFSPGKLTLQARGDDVGSSEVTMKLEGLKDEVEIAFDPIYVLDFFRAIDAEPTVNLEMTDHEKPAVFRLGDYYSYLIMPMGS